mmetsp:Transcript_57506/g.171037  ORF Transcript_57506/g.171037 Transcript_57506/m.171037 type:complete len:271 (+) Transcript_57506:41-853(+)
MGRAGHRRRWRDRTGECAREQHERDYGEAHVEADRKHRGNGARRLSEGKQLHHAPPARRQRDRRRRRQVARAGAVPERHARDARVPGQPDRRPRRTIAREHARVPLGDQGGQLVASGDRLFSQRRWRRGRDGARAVARAARRHAARGAAQQPHRPRRPGCSRGGHPGECLGDGAAPARQHVGGGRGRRRARRRPSREHDAEAAHAGPDGRGRARRHRPRRRARSERDPHLLLHRRQRLDRCAGRTRAGGGADARLRAEMVRGGRGGAGGR